jgi:hypothetical protein
VNGPVLWLTDKPIDDGGSKWNTLRRAFPTTGLWPVLLGGMREAPDRPWVSAELDPQAVAQEDPRAILAERWAGGISDEFEDDPDERQKIEPFGREFPGLASVSADPLNEREIERVAKDIAKGRRLGLAEVSRAADLPAVTGWSGSVNVIDSGTVSAILRSWEERFGVVLVGLEFDTMTLVAMRCPTTDDESLAVAAEHYMFCPDNIDQGVGSIRAYAKALKKLARWDFWWD